MKRFENESVTERLERVIRKEVIPKLTIIVDGQSEKLAQLIMRHSKLKIVTKNQYIEESGAFEDGKLFYLLSGIARSFYYDSFKNKPVVPRIWKKGEVILDIDSFQHKADCIESVQMLEQGEVLSISYSSLKQMLIEFPEMISFLLSLVAERERYSRFYEQLLKLPANERVNLYLNHNPGISNRINKDCIALHLGISRSKFSSAYALYKRRKD